MTTALLSDRAFLTEEARRLLEDRASVLAALATLTAGGQTYVDADAVPEPEPAAALLRW